MICVWPPDVTVCQHIFIALLFDTFILYFRKYQQRLPYDLLSSLANALIDGTVFQIVLGLKEVQEWEEKAMFQQRSKLMSDHKGIILIWIIWLHCNVHVYTLCVKFYIVVLFPVLIYLSILQEIFTIISLYS